MMLSHRIELVPTLHQVVYFRKASGTARFTYNWGLARWNEMYAAGEKPNQYKLKAELNAIKSELFPWMYEVTKCAPEAALADLGIAFGNYFRGLGKKQGRKARRPKFKKKGQSRDSFYLSNDQFVVEGDQIRIPHLGWVTMRESLRFEGKLLGATVSRTADRWFVAIQVEVAREVLRRENQAPVGMDLGILHAVTLSTGKTYDSPKSLEKNLKKLRRLNRALARTKKGGQNREKAKQKLARLYYRIACLRSDFLHKTTTGITRHYGLIAMEDLNVAGMLANHRLARAISDVGLGELARQLKYKAENSGGLVIQVGRFFPSSKKCRKCGTKLENLPLAQRVFRCPVCGHTEDRDLHAARNILREGQKIAKNTGGPSGIDACGQAAATKKRNRFASRLNEAGRQEATADDGLVKHQEKVANGR